MKKLVIIFLIFSVCFSQSIVQAQEIKGRTPAGAVYIQKDPPKPADLVFAENSLVFVDADKNLMIDADESCYIKFSIENKGLGDGLNLKVIVKETTGNTGLQFLQSTGLGNLKVGQKLNVEIPVKGKHSLINGNASFTVIVEELNGFNSETVSVEVKTREFQAPRLTIVEYPVSCRDGGKTIQYNRPFEVNVLIQNKGYGRASDAILKITYPPNILLGEGEAETIIGQLEPNESKVITYSFTIPRSYQGTSIPMNLKLSESYNKYGENKDIVFEVNQAVVENKIVVQGIEQNQPVITDVSLTSDVDKNIPVTSVKNPHIYALIIGNQDYSSYQTGLNSEVNVDFARNDAEIFASYVENTLGAESKKVNYIPDATLGKMNRGLAWLIENAVLDKGDAEIIFYYSGHGLPDEETKEAYLMPTDVSGVNVREGIKLDKVIADITAVPSKRATLFIDACFSGGARNQGLLAAKPGRLKPEPNLLKGKLVMFSSSSGVESSGVYRDKQHGFFTYYLLKKLQETKGDINYMDLGKYLKEEVQKETTIISKPQTPQVQYSKEVENEWGEWKMK